MKRHDITITPSDNIIDSRDVIARLTELEAWQEEALQAAADAHQTLADVKDLEPGVEIPDDITDAIDSLWTAVDGREYALTDDWTEETAEELQALKSLAEQCESQPDWGEGAALINDDYFETYARDMAEDIGAINRDARWPCNHIDWEAAADELKNDYSMVQWEDGTFYIRD